VLIAIYIVASLVQTTGIDFAAFYWAGWCVIHDQPDLMYDNASAKLVAPGWDGFHDSNVTPFVYVPAFAFLMAPFALLPFGTALNLWLLLRLVLILMSALVLMRAAWGDHPIKTRVGLSLLLASGPMVIGQYTGQSNALVLALIVTAMLLLSRKHHRLGGIISGLAPLVKPLGLVVVLFTWQSHKTICWAVLTMCIVGLFAGGWQLGDWWQSLEEPLGRHIDFVPYSSSISSVLIPYLGTAGLTVYLLACLGAGLLSLYMVAREDRVLSQGAIATSYMLAFYPTVQRHYLILSVIPFVVLFDDPELRQRVSGRAAYVIALAAVFFTAYQPGYWPFWHLPVIGTTGIWLLSIAATHWRRNARATGSPVSTPTPRRS